MEDVSMIIYCRKQESSSQGLSRGYVQCDPVITRSKILTVCTLYLAHAARYRVRVCMLNTWILLFLRNWPCRPGGHYSDRDRGALYLDQVIANHLKTGYPHISFTGALSSSELQRLDNTARHHDSMQPLQWSPGDILHGPLTRYVKLRVAHAPGMPGTFSPPPTSKESTARASRTCRDR